MPVALSPLHSTKHKTLQHKKNQTLKIKYLAVTCRRKAVLPILYNTIHDKQRYTT